jgi:phosphoribosylaminoimidazole-succinocarboxamide synthase
MSDTQIRGWKHVYSGKVRDLYESLDEGQSDLILIVASNRISAFDHVLEPEITGKGENLTSVTNWWFDRLPVPNHRVLGVEVPKEVSGRGTIARKLEMYPIECVVRGYLTGSGYKDYLRDGEICGVKLPAGLKDGAKLPSPIFTPAFKAEVGEHDENISFERVIELIGEEKANELRDLSIKVFEFASELCEKAGLILADTKFEFGKDPATGETVLADEVLTPDSSRFWSKEAYSNGSFNESFDKQIVRNWLKENWDPSGESAPPRLPESVVIKTSSKYAELRDKLTSL